MNVYVRELVSSLAQLGVECVTYTRATSHAPREVRVEPNHLVVHVPAGPFDLPKESLPDVIDAFTDGVRRDIEARGGVDVIHGNYWLSGVAGHRLKHELDVPLVMTFHTFARVKAEGGDREPLLRELTEAEILGCTDAVCVSCENEDEQFRRLYGDPVGRTVVVSPGVEHAFFGPGDMAGARRAVGLPAGPLLLFVGRIQPLKGLDIAVETLARLSDERAKLVVVGGASGSEGSSEVARLSQLISQRGLEGRVLFVPPQPHHILSSFYRAADVVLVPSRSESFGLVALEAAACGVPVVASAVGGLLTLVDDASTGFLVPDRDPSRFAAHVDRLLASPAVAAEMGFEAHLKSRAYTWRSAGSAVLRTYEELSLGSLVTCT
jgi:D-inositol-3-phosphate glycosyltransferase